MRALVQFCLALCVVGSMQAEPHPLQGASLAVPASAPSNAIADFSAEPLVVVNHESITRMHADGTGERENSLVLRVQSEAMLRQFGVITIQFASAAEHVDFLYARVRHPDGTVIETPVADAVEQTEQVTREAPFYSDLKTKQLPVKNLRLGDTLEWKVRIVRTIPEAPGQFWGQDTFVDEGVALREVVELHVPAGSHVTIWTNPATAVPSDTISGTDRVIRWTQSHLVPTAGPVAAAAAESKKKKPLTPEEELNNRKGAFPSLAWTTFPSWEAVGAWYRGLEADRMKPDPTVKAKVAELTAGKSTEAEKALAVYDYVATNIRYIGVAFGVGRYQPHTAAEVLANQYGDCKDKHTLLAAMLTQLGLQPDAVLVGAGVRFNPALPSPGAFNHLITRVSLDGKTVWLDATTEVAPWGSLLPVIRDQDALVVPEVSSARVEQTPAMLPFPAYAKLTATETLDGQFTSDARVTLTFHDDDEIALRSVLRGISPAQYEEFLQRFVGGMGFGGTATEPEFSRPDDLEHPLTLSFKYQRIRQEEWGTNRITEPFMPFGIPVVDEKEPPVASLELGIPRIETSSVKIKLPQGWSAELPEATHARSPFATSDTTFHLENGVITAERTLTVLAKQVPAANWKTYKKWSDDAGLNTFPYIQMVPITQKALAPIPPPPGHAPEAAPAGKTAEQLVAAAAESLRALNIPAAQQQLDQARALNPQQRYLWSAYGGLAYALGKITEASEDTQKELTLHPDEVQMNGMLANLQHTRGHDDAALASLHRWEEGAPADPSPAIALMGMLHTLKRDAEAIELGSSSLRQLSSGTADLTQIRLVLADLQARAGRKADAAATVLPLAATVTDPSQQNSVAYILADAGVELSADEAVERGVLEKLDAETANWTLDESPFTLAAQTNLLIASWDTMGWILYREGNLPEARRYIEAAWRNTPREEMQEHVRVIDSAMHRSSAAEVGSDQERRTFPLGAAKARRGTAELRLLLAAGKVLRSEPVAAPVVAGVEHVSNTKAAPDLPDAAELVKSADLHLLFPEKSGAHLVRTGIVNCSGVTCQLVLEPLSAR